MFNFLPRNGLYYRDCLSLDKVDRSLKAAYARVTTATTGATLTAAIWNDEFDAVLDSVNSISNAQIASDAAIAYSKLSLTGAILNADLAGSIATTKISGTAVTLAGTESLSNKTFSDAITMTQIATPSNPAASNDKIYFKSDDKLYQLTSGGTESLVGGQTASALAYQSAAQSISNTTDTAVNLQTESFDTDAIHSTSSNITRFTVPTAGKWLFVGQIQYPSNATGGRAAALRLNGTTTIGETLSATSPDSVTYIQVSTIANLSANDYVELMAYQSSTTSLNLGTGADKTYLSCHRLS